MTKLQDIVYPVIQRNAYMVHSESVLLTMVCDADIDIRRLAQQRIVDARSQNNSIMPIFILPKLDFNADIILLNIIMIGLNLV